MNTKHEKSPCCQERIIRFGRRRRQCSVCRKTWRVWKRKRGRDVKRHPLKALFKYLDNHNGSLSEYALDRHIQPSTFRARIRSSLIKFIDKTAWLDIPDGPLIAIADALNQIVKGETRTIYFILLRSVSSTEAIITLPFIHQGTESGTNGWYEAFDALPYGVKNRIVALVCDGRNTLVCLARKEQWLLQRCHFHIIWSIANYTRIEPLSRTRGTGLQVKSLVDIILTNPDRIKTKRAAANLNILKKEINSKGLQKVLTGFIKHHSDFRTYLLFPELNLLITTNTAESLIGKVRNLQYRAKGFRSIDSLLKWVIALCKKQGFIVCRGRKNQPN